MDNKVKIKDGKINFKCLGDKCPMNCCSKFDYITRDVEPLKQESEEGLLTKKDIKNLKQANCESYIENTGKESKLKVKENGECFLLKNEKCTIYNNRPTVCRAFPFYIDMLSGLSMVTTKCPGVGAGWTDISELKDSIKAATDIYELWIKKIRKDIKKNNLL